MGKQGKRKKADNGLSPLQVEAKLLCDEATGYLKAANYGKALAVYNQALQLCPEDKTALVARSKCYLLLGQPRLALQDAETALEPDRNFVRAIFQKAEALYHLGDFEHSLMYYHRGLRLRPELAVFRLGVQKAQEAIENTIGRGKGSMKPKLVSPSSVRRGSGSAGSTPSPVPGTGTGTATSKALQASQSVTAEAGDRGAPSPVPVQAPGRGVSPAASPIPGVAGAGTLSGTLIASPSVNAPGSTRSHSSRSSRSSKTNRLANNGPSSGSTEGEEQSARRLLGELCVDKLYLEQLLKHPDIRCARKDRNRTSQIAEHAEDGVEFLRNRQEFWRQQKLSTGPGGVAVSGGGGSARRMQPSPGGHGSGSARSSARLTTASPQAVT